MFKPLFLILLFTLIINAVHAQKKYINRKVAQKNYEGYMLMQEHKYDSAIILFNQALNDDPEASFIYQNRAICKMHLKDTLGAITDFKNNIKLEPGNAESKYALGNIYKHQKDSLQALNYFIPAIEQASDDFSQKKLLYMNNFAGHYFRATEDYDSALVFYERVKRYTPENASVYINSAVCNFHLDRLGLFCADLERAFVLGGKVNCIALKSYCDGCKHLLEERGKTDTLSRELDTRLAGIIPDTVYHPVRSYNSLAFKSDSANTKLRRVYYNKLWQICLKKDATFYREALWAKGYNFYYNEFTDYYINGNVYAKGTLSAKQLTGSYKSYYPDGTLKLVAEFTKGNPVGTWTYYLESGQPDFQVKFFLDEFTITILDESSTNIAVNSGNGKFKLELDKWEKVTFILAGEYENKKRTGNWYYAQNNRKVVNEFYKKGQFRRGTMLNDYGQSFTLAAGSINALTFIPPQMIQVQNLYFDSMETVKHYPFITLPSF